MNPDPQKAEELFERALQFQPEERAAFLAGACGNDVHLRRRVEELLMAAETAQSHRIADQPTEVITSFSNQPLPKEGAGSLIGRYKLLEKLGEGGFGSVWAAEQREPVRRRVALKIIKLGMDTKQVVARFEAERQALALMDHPNIARVLDAGATETGRPYFVMELVKGIPITRYCDEEKLSIRERIELFIKVCNAIQHAHQKGIIHRDIKPSNILVTLHDGKPVPKVIDFGIAKATQLDLTDKTIYTQYSQFIGTPAYMSPEQAELSGLDMDTRSDIYSLGVLLYELLTGTTPFDSHELMQSGVDEMRKIIREREPVKPSTRVSQTLASNSRETKRQKAGEPGSNIAGKPFEFHAVGLLKELKGDLDWIVMKCLEKDRTRRYETANALASDLERHLSNEPVLARPPSKIYRFRKAVRRNKLAFAAAGSVVAALVLGLGLATWAFIRENQAYEQTLAAEQEQSRLHQEAVAAQRTASEQRDLARQRLYHSLLREAGSIRKARQIGYRNEVFDRLRQAMALQTPDVDATLLRREAAACMGDWVGLEPVDIFLPSTVAAACLTADGSLAAHATADGLVTLWETANGHEVASLEVGGIPYSLVFHPRGLTLFVVTSDEPLSYSRRPDEVSIQQWSLWGDGTWKREKVTPVEGWCWVASTDQGPVSLMVAPSNSFFQVSDLVRGEELNRVPIAGPMPHWPKAAMSRDRRQLAFFSLETADGFDVQLETWDLETMRRKAELQPRLGPGYGLDFSPNGQFLVATYDNTLVVYDTERFSSSIHMGGAYENTLGGAIGGSAGLLAVPTGQEIAVRLIRLQTGGEVAYLKLPGPAISLDFSEDGGVLLLTHRSGSRIVRLNAEPEKVRLEGHQGGVPVLAFSPDGNQLASAGKDRTLRFWDLSRPGEHRVLGELPAPGQTLHYTPDGQFLITGFYNTSALSVWSTETGRRISHIPETTNVLGTTWSGDISPDGTFYAAIGNSLRIWRTEDLINPATSDGNAHHPMLTLPEAAASVVFNRKGTRAYYMGDGRPNDNAFIPVVMEKRLDADTRPRTVATNIQNNFIQAISIVPGTDNLVYVTPRREIAVLDPLSGETLKTIPTMEPGDTTPWFAANLQPSPDGTMLAMLSLSGLGVDLRDTETGKLLYTLPEETGAIWWLTWSPDSRRVAITRANGAIDIWNLEVIETQLEGLGLKP